MIGDPDQWFDPAAFALQPAGTYGNLGRGALIGPDLRVVDMALVKRIPWSRLGAQGRAELRLEVAGGGAAEGRLAYLSEDKARTLRAELLARAAGVRPDAPEAPEQVLVRVPVAALMTSLLLTVWEENHRAKRFYERHGFEHVGDYAFAFGEKVDRDLVMRLAL